MKRPLPSLASLLEIERNKLLTVSGRPALDFDADWCDFSLGSMTTFYETFPMP
jgi:hypothetical protein